MTPIRIKGPPSAVRVLPAYGIPGTNLAYDATKICDTAMVQGAMESTVLTWCLVLYQPLRDPYTVSTKGEHRHHPSEYPSAHARAMGCPVLRQRLVLRGCVG